MSMPRMMAVVFGALLAISPVMAEPYWVSWSGDSYPEEEGWTRFFQDANAVPGQGGAIRTIDHGAMLLDSRQDSTIVDNYSMSGFGLPEPGEAFSARWRVRVDEVPAQFPYDPGVAIANEEGWRVGFQLSEGGIRSVLEGAALSLEPHVFHEFEFRTADMISNDLLVDGQPGLTGTFRPSSGGVRVAWGDFIQGSRSLSTWDFVEFGVVPEPTLPLFVISALLVITKGVRR